MPLSKKAVEELDREFKGDLKSIPLGKIICVAKAGWKAYRCKQKAARTASRLWSKTSRRA
jgi:predicted transcriptional regulator with HTH domain